MDAHELYRPCTLRFDIADDGDPLLEVDGRLCINGRVSQNAVAELFDSWKETRQHRNHAMQANGEMLINGTKVHMHRLWNLTLAAGVSKVGITGCLACAITLMSESAR